MDLQLRDRVIVITGGTSGIGAATALALAREGACPVMMGLDALPLQLSDDLQQAGVRFSHHTVDLRDHERVATIIDSIVTEYGRIDGLVNNAGITQDNLLMRMKEDEWHSVVDTNLNALYRLCKGCLRGMTKAKWGRVINITSVVGSMGNAGQSNYAATKAGAEGMARSLARELGSRSITVNCVAPGFIDTDMTRALNEAQRAGLQSQIPLGRLGLPEDIAETVAFLVSDGAQYVTGETIHVNGGLYMG